MGGAQPYPDRELGRSFIGWTDTDRAQFRAEMVAAP